VKLIDKLGVHRLSLKKNKIKSKKKKEKKTSCLALV
jgi:hypothetical protein